MTKTNKKQIRIKNHFIYTLLLVAVALTVIFVSVKKGFRIDHQLIKWDATGGGSNITPYIFLSMPLILLLIIFLFRKNLSSISNDAKNYIWITLGMTMIFWQLWWDVTSIKDGEKMYGNLNKAMLRQFINGFIFCRLNMYVAGVFLVLRKIDMLKWVVATSFFGGIVSVYGEYKGQASIHSLLTHSIFLTVFPFYGVTLSRSNYRVKNLIHSHLFNWTLVIVMLGINYHVNGGFTENSSKYGFPSIAGELTIDRLENNALVGWLKWPGNLFMWIFIVMLLEIIVFSIYRLINWRTYKRNLTFKETFTTEHKIDSVSWYGFKQWGENSWPRNYKKNLKQRWS